MTDSRLKIDIRRKRILEQLRLEGKVSVNALCDALNDLTGRVEASFVLDRLDYMVKGGRCSSAAALGANLLNLKPCIEVRDGKMSVVKKYRGNYSKCLANYVKDRLDGRDDLDTSRLFITRTPVSDESYAAVKEAVGKYGHFDEVFETEAGCKGVELNEDAAIGDRNVTKIEAEGKRRCADHHNRFRKLDLRE